MSSQKLDPGLHADLKQPAPQARPKALLDLHGLPSWRRDNQYILSGYAPNSGSLKLSLKDACRWHNETINTLSHAIGAVLFAILPVHFYLTQYTKQVNAEPIDFRLISVYLLGTCLCFTCSARYHAILNHSASVAASARQIDCCGIVVLMWSASIPTIHFGFISNPWYRDFHWVLTTLCASACLAINLHPHFLSPAGRSYRLAAFVGLGASWILFLSHAFYLQGLALTRSRMGLDWMAVVAILDAVGAATYGFRFPEKWFPHRFDYLGASHQVFHVAVLIAAIAHYKSLTDAFLAVRGRNA